MSGGTQAAHAQDLYTITGAITNGGPIENFSTSFSNSDDFFSFFETGDPIRALGVNYIDDFSAAAATIDYQGVEILLAFPFVGSAAVQYSVLGETVFLSETDVGFDRDFALDLVYEGIFFDGGPLQQAFQAALLQSSPNNPAAGNPNSLQSRMITDDFNFSGFDTSANTPSTGTTINRVFIGVSGGTFSANGVNGETFSVPLSYTARFDDDPRYQLQFALPLTFINQGDTASYSGSLGVGFQFPLTSIDAKNQWYLTPRISLGGVTTPSESQATLLANASITSRYTMGIGSIPGEFTLANLVGYNFSIDLNLEDYRGDYDIGNLTLKNGLLYELPVDFNLFGDNQLSFQGSYALTNLIGTDLFMNTFHDVSVSLGTQDTGMLTKMLRLGFTGSFGREFQKYVVNIGYVF
ncbi:MAG: hypothetical protein AAF607_02440 [Pseudomonadota bacterium]